MKTFAQQMIADHSKANDELQAVASRAGVTPPTEPDKNHAARLARLGKLTGPQFDKTYIQGEIPEHWETIALFEKEAKSGQNPDLKAFAANTLPTLQRHLQMAEDTSTQVAK